MCQIYDLWWVNYCTITTKSKAPRPLPPPLFLISSALMHLFRDKWAEPGGVEDWGYFRCRLPGFGDRCGHHLYLQMSWQKQVGSAVFFFFCAHLQLREGLFWESTHSPNISGGTQSTVQMSFTYFRSTSSQYYLLQSAIHWYNLGKAELHCTHAKIDFHYNPIRTILWHDFCVQPQSL